ncbi:glucan endo-1,3-beta-glucosidase GVI [Dorcoceras hygrometricum]|uniref:Glucan endo-1,3-beta-glucosidase GVI n=1 Tax=Dorcoceras hygrometricum TaxID=472368 RepID=A0A2Z7CJQ2_9LAMI|nr:glucan endo-1,3-beta-glucosidase GVI [Dorcoceras hygrometricum]
MEQFHAIVFVISFLWSIHPGARGIGINYGLLGDNLPVPADVISELKARGISKIRVFEPRPDVLAALKGSEISVIVGTRNEDLQALASDLSMAVSWVETNVLPYQPWVHISCISAGNEVIPGELAAYVPGAMQNLDSALTAANLAIPVSTAVSMSVLAASYPPSQGVFSAEASPVMAQVVAFLACKNSPLLLNVYPYFAYVGDPVNVPLDYALFEGTASPVPDYPFIYYNLFDAMVDAAYAALEKVGGASVEIIAAETGWPTDGSSVATISNAQIYVNNLIQHVSSGVGTPRRPGKVIDTYIFAMFNEDLKPAGVEQHWGLYYPNLIEVYHANF